MCALFFLLAGTLAQEPSRGATQTADKENPADSVDGERTGGAVESEQGAVSDAEAEQAQTSRELRVEQKAGTPAEPAVEKAAHHKLKASQAAGTQRESAEEKQRSGPRSEQETGIHRETAKDKSASGRPR
jgi:hypothetical protein